MIKKMSDIIEYVDIFQQDPYFTIQKKDSVSSLISKFFSLIIICLTINFAYIDISDSVNNNDFTINTIMNNLKNNASIEVSSKDTMLAL